MSFVRILRVSKLYRIISISFSLFSFENILDNVIGLEEYTNIANSSFELKRPPFLSTISVAIAPLESHISRTSHSFVEAIRIT